MCWKVCKKPGYWKTKTGLNFLILVGDFDTEALCISEVGMIFQLVSKETVHFQDRRVSPNFTCYYMYLWELS